MRLAILLTISAALYAADQEVLVLKDGRQLTGVYDESSGVLDMGMAKLKVAASEIDHREKAKQPARPAKTDGLIDAPTDPVAEYQARIAELDAARLEAIATLRKKVAARIMSMDLRIVERGQNADDVNQAVMRMREYINAVKVDEFLRSTPREYQDLRGARTRSVNDLFLQAIPLLIDPILAASYAASRSMKLTDPKDYDPVASERDDFRSWQRSKEAERAAKREAERQPRGGGGSNSGGGVTLGAPRKVN